MNLLDKNIRYVNGIKIDISKEEESYYKVLLNEREKNKRLGYGDDSKNWERKRYENQRRNLIKLEMIKNNKIKHKEKIEPIEENINYDNITLGDIKDAF